MQTRVLRMKSQWECFLNNVGAWHGSFTRMTPHGEVTADQPTVVTIAGLEQNQRASLTVEYLQNPARNLSVIYDGTLDRNLLFFETGAFCRGSTQFSPDSPFGGELGLTTGERRLRLVQMFNTENQIDYLVLIREALAGSNAPERPALNVTDLIGTWEGTAITLTPDQLEPQTYPTHLVIQRQGDILSQELRFGNRAIATQARINGSCLQFEDSPLPVQILLLPDGASANCPTQVKVGYPFVLELGWLLDRGLRQRLIRSYDAKGSWVGATWVTEHKILG
jgi:hypothetical protein